ncbi:anti-sigma factor family protein [Streptomyces sp. NPDC058442]|uniref:anti-sigma factor family protein n=1 Tax=Streptomyces sp. NPDC058442 TaxID=3346503 RepID=UPI00365626F5
MTSTPDMTEHPDVAEISDLTEGILPPARTAAVRRHLDECDLCADVHASLEEIRGLLGAVPGTPRMPAEVASRIDAALAAEALLHARAPGSEKATELVGVSPSSSDEDRAHVSRETSTSTGRPSGRPRPSTTGPGRKDRMQRGRRKAAVLGTVLTVATLGLGTLFLTSQNDETGPGVVQQTASDTFTESELGKQVSDLLAQNQRKGASSRMPQTLEMESEPEVASPRVFQQPTVPACVRGGIGRDDAALATEQGIYKGREALLVVLPNPSDDTRVTAYIVDATCVGNPSSATTAKVLLKNSYTRG